MPDALSVWRRFLEPIRRNAVVSLLSQLRAPEPPTAAKEAELAQQLALLTAPFVGGSAGAAASAWLKSASPPAASSVRPKSPPHDSLADEEELLEQARRAASSSPAEAMSLLQQHQQRFPAGQLAAERMFLSVDVLTRLGDKKGARRQADALVRLFPSSAYATQIKARGQ